MVHDWKRFTELIDGTIVIGNGYRALFPKLPFGDRGLPVGERRVCGGEQQEDIHPQRMPFQTGHMAIGHIQI